jgi:hypothetical protein
MLSRIVFRVSFWLGRVSRFNLSRLGSPIFKLGCPGRRGEVLHLTAGTSLLSPGFCLELVIASFGIRLE